MLFLLSPAKTLDYDSAVPADIARQSSAPLFAAQGAQLIAVLKKKTPRQVAKLMDLSDKLAQLNVQRYRDWREDAAQAQHKPALLAFNGDVYDGLDAKTLSRADMAWANQHLVILSGLYGALRPLDQLQPYRLEMGTALRTRKGKSLYAFWGDTVAQHLNERLADDAAPVVVNLASVEYARVALRPALKARVVDCVFEDRAPGDGEYKVISFFAKKARGMLARWAVQQRVSDVARLVDFDAGGYAYMPARSTPTRLVFRRVAA